MNYYLTPKGSELITLSYTELLAHLVQEKTEIPTIQAAEFENALKHPSVVFMKPDQPLGEMIALFEDLMLSAVSVRNFVESANRFATYGWGTLVVSVSVSGRYLLLGYHPISIKIIDSIVRKDIIDSILNSL